MSPDAPASFYMNMLKNTDRISIQVGLSGYSFKLHASEGVLSSTWMTAERIFTTAEFQRRYDEVDISVFTPKCALIPSQFHDPQYSREALAEVADIQEGDSVGFVEVPELASVLVYSNSIGETLTKVISETVIRTDGSKARPYPEMYYMLKALPSVSEYNKIIASYVDGWLYLVVAQGKSLVLCNAYKAQDFTTAEYFIFLAMKRLQLNPEVSTISFRTPLLEDEEMSLYRYFKNVEHI